MANYTHPVNQLLTLGDHREMKEKWPDCAALGIGPEHIPELIRMATDEELNWGDSESLEVWAPLHAWKALGVLRAEEAIEPLLNLFHELEDDDWVGEVLPEVYGRIGPAAIPALKAYIADESHESFPRIHAVEGLACIGESHSDAREACVQALMGQLEAYKKNGYELNAFLIHNLVELEAVEAAPLMERAFVANLVDESLRGDWEEVQMDLGLKPFRETPAFDDVPVRWKDPMRWREPEMKTLSNPDQLNAAKRAKAKKKRKMEKETRKKNRKRKK